MRQKQLKLSVVLLLGLGLTGLQAQENFNVTGATASGIGGSVCYSVGQLEYLTHTGQTGSVAEGVQQPFEISIVTAIEKIFADNLSVLAYPIPSSDFLLLRANDLDGSDLSYQLYDINGNLLKSNEITGNKTIINMSILIPATYFIKVIRNNKEIRIFKVIKN